METVNFLFVFGIVASGVFYFVFKTRQFRTSHMFPIRKKMYASMAGTALGALLIFFGINQLLLFEGVLTYVVAGIFILFGGYVTLFNFKAMKHYKQFVEEERTLNEN
ncbi:YtpI family protein [Sporosarcina obsidiansis]|uniref:YtpI family protein n=1 Tax=Sporosarcina obsidiansis TaxID=2660748 RepID=UPI00129B17ED|nr:YtpI family protein [Sporosarcina obsidiansis]